jgi:hypothetical protein
MEIPTEVNDRGRAQFFICDRTWSPLLVTIKSCINAMVAIWALSVKIGQKLAKFMLKFGIATLSTFFCYFQLAGKKIISIFYFSQTNSKTPKMVSMVTILKLGVKREFIQKVRAKRPRTERSGL